MTKIEVTLTDDAFQFQGVNERGNVVQMDVSPDQGGQGSGAGPMQLLLMGIGGCSGIDILSILRKGRNQVDSFAASIEGDRAEGEVPSLYKDIRIHYALSGTDLDPEKVRRAIDLSLEKYCSVSKTLEATAAISYTFAVNEVEYAE